MLRFLTVPALLILISCSPSTETPDNGTRTSETDNQKLPGSPRYLLIIYTYGRGIRNMSKPISFPFMA
jgi:hypothetical protein